MNLCHRKQVTVVADQLQFSRRTPQTPPDQIIRLGRSGGENHLHTGAAQISIPSARYPAIKYDSDLAAVPAPPHFQTRHQLGFVVLVAETNVVEYAGTD